MYIFKFGFHDEVRDVVSGAVGKVVGQTEWDNHCIRYTIQSPVGKDGKIPDTFATDEQNLVLVKAAPERRSERAQTGGPPTYKGAEVR